MPEKILMVDDEEGVLQGYQRMFRKDFEIETAPDASMQQLEEIFHLD